MAKVIHLEEVFTAAIMATPIKEIKSGKAVGNDEIRPKMLKALTKEGILWLKQLCQVAWKYGQTPRDWQAGVIFPIFKKGDRKQYIYYREISLLSFPEKVYTKCLKKCRKIVESKLETASAVFVRVAEPRTRSSLWSKSSRNLGSMTKISLHVLSILKKHMTEFLGVKFGRFYGNMAFLMVSCYVPLRHFIGNRRFVFG